MVSLVLVSHSNQLATATLKLVRSMSGDEVSIAIAAGIGDNFEELGTDAMEIYQAITSVMSDDGVVIIMDMGSAVLSTDMALDFLDEEQRKKVKLSSASFVEGAVAAGVSCKVGNTIDEVIREANNSLQQKTEHIEPENHETEEKEIDDKRNYVSTEVAIRMPHGIHARPATQLIQIASKYQSEIKVKNVSNGKGPVSARSMTGIMSLEALFENTIQILASGEDQDLALKDLKEAIQKGLGDEVVSPKEKKTVPIRQNTHVKPIGISKGIVIGEAFYPQISSIKIANTSTENVEKEIERLKEALSKTKLNLQQKAKSTLQQGAIFEAQAILMDDPELVENAYSLIKGEKLSAEKAWWQTLEKAINAYKKFNDPNLRQRALDLEDAAKAVLSELGVSINDKLSIPKEGIIIVGDLTPRQVDSLDTSNIKGVICLDNGQTSHSAILLRSRGIPSIVLARGNEEDINHLPDGTIIVMDGEKGIILLNPSTEQQNKIKTEQEILAKQEALELAQCLNPAISKDGVHIHVFANVGNRADAEKAAINGADGIGLLRTEFMFLERQTAPSEDEQVEMLRTMLEPMKGKPIIIRTLDAGGDKNIPYLNMPPEENPFLGVRAIRLCLKNKPLFQEQLKAILRISTDFDVRIMFPMIATLEELEEAKSELNIAHESLLKQSIAHKWPIATGMMMEVPSSTILADKFAPEVDFFSIGTNDLVQYTMAADRGNPDLQTLRGNGLTPSVLRLIRHIVEAAKANKIDVGVCGEAAANPELANLLLGLGVNELSMNARSIPNIKYYIREKSIRELGANAQNAIN